MALDDSLFTKFANLASKDDATTAQIGLGSGGLTVGDKTIKPVSALASNRIGDTLEISSDKFKNAKEVAFDPDSKQYKEIIPLDQVAKRKGFGSALKAYPASFAQSVFTSAANNPLMALAVGTGTAGAVYELGHHEGKTQTMNQLAQGTPQYNPQVGGY